MSHVYWVVMLESRPRLLELLTPCYLTLVCSAHRSCHRYTCHAMGAGYGAALPKAKVLGKDQLLHNDCTCRF